MEPLLSERRDTVAVSPLSERAKKYDVVLYRRGDKYIFHRVVKVLPDSYVICGDNCIALEKGITDADIIGKMTSLHRANKEINLNGTVYKAYSVCAVMARPLRSVARRGKSALGKAFRKCKKK